MLYISNSRAPKAVEWAVENEEWQTFNEPHLAALESETADKPARLEEAEVERLRVVAEVADLREKLARSESREAKLEATNVTLNTARDEAIAGSIAV